MRRNSICLLLMLFIYSIVSAQLNDSFDDGNFSADPTWIGNAASWQIINSDVAAGAVNSNTLRLNVATGSGVAYLSTQIPGSWGMGQSWSFFVGRRAQAYTAANYAMIWLWCNEPDITSLTADGYRIRIGDDSGGDDIVLQRVTDGVATNVLVSASAIANNLTDIGFLLRVTRSATGVWQMFTSELPASNGSGAIATDVPTVANTPVSQGTVTDNFYTDFANGYIGFVNGHGSTAAARATQEFDQVRVSLISEALPVKVQQLLAKNENGVNKLSWQAVEENGVWQYRVERSTDGLNFISIGAVNAERKSNYYYIDSQRAAGNSFYRLRVIDNDGTGVLTYIVSAKNKEHAALSVFPNPARSLVTVHHPAADFNSRLLLMNVSGIVVKQINLPENAVVTSTDVSGLSPGLYYISFTTGNTKLARMIIKE